MATRAAARFLQRRFLSSGGKVLSEEEKAAENVYIKVQISLLSLSPSFLALLWYLLLLDLRFLIETRF